MKAFSWLVIGMVAYALSISQAPAQDLTISIDTPPPALVEDVQPACPQDGYIWTPGYWAYDQDTTEYYWVDGAWVQPPEVGLLWTPAYWGWSGNNYAFYPGYWGPTVGFYGGVNYGHGYWGNGYGGGRWNGNQFSYNLAANNVARDRIHNTYEDRSVVRSSSRRVSYNGGKGGTSVQPTAEERQGRQQARSQLTPQQQSHLQAATQTRAHAVKAKSARPVAAGNPAVTPKQQATSPSSFTGEPQAPRHDVVAPTENSLTGERKQPSTAASSFPTASEPNERHVPQSSPTHEAPLTRETPAPREAPMTRETPATHEAPLTREAPATREAPLTHEAPASHAAPGPAVRPEVKTPAPQAKPEVHAESHAAGPAQGQNAPQSQPQDKH